MGVIALSHCHCHISSKELGWYITFFPRLKATLHPGTAKPIVEITGLIGKPAEFLFAELGVSAGRLQALKVGGGPKVVSFPTLLLVASRQAVAIIPFALKPLVALLSDAFPIAGYHKLPYVVGALDPG